MIFLEMVGSEVLEERASAVNEYLGNPVSSISQNSAVQTGVQEASDHPHNISTRFRLILKAI